MPRTKVWKGVSNPVYRINYKRKDHTQRHYRLLFTKSDLGTKDALATLITSEKTSQ
jgi:hypothetical protein